MRISDWSSDVCSSDLSSARALEAGQEVYAHYGDAAAKPRIAIALRRGRREMTGSRTGMVGSLKIYVPGPGGYQQIDGSKFYDARYWEPEKYQQRSEEHTSELQSLMRNSYPVFCLKKKKRTQ